MSGTARRRLGLPDSPEAAGLARRAVRELLAMAGADDQNAADDAATLVSELVANAVQHARPRGQGALRLDAQVEGERLRVAVHDPDPRSPAPGHADPNAERGRGLAIVAALAKEWGVTPDERGKHVWFTLALAPRP